MGILFDYAAGGPEGAGRTFQDWVAADIQEVFLSTIEFAQPRAIRYDGVTYRDIPVVEVGPKEGKRSSVVQMQHDFGQGLYKRSVTIYCAVSDLGGNKPEQGSHLSMSEVENSGFFHSYRVVESTTEMGMYRVKLEEVDE